MKKNLGKYIKNIKDHFPSWSTIKSASLLTLFSVINSVALPAIGFTDINRLNKKENEIVASSVPGKTLDNIAAYSLRPKFKSEPGKNRYAFGFGAGLPELSLFKFIGNWNKPLGYQFVLGYFIVGATARADMRLNYEWGGPLDPYGFFGANAFINFQDWRAHPAIDFGVGLEWDIGKPDKLVLGLEAGLLIELKKPSDTIGIPMNLNLTYRK